MCGSVFVGYNFLQMSLVSIVCRITFIIEWNLVISLKSNDGGLMFAFLFCMMGYSMCWAWVVPTFEALGMRSSTILKARSYEASRFPTDEISHLSRKKHKNKYEHLSKNLVDPLIATINSVNAEKFKLEQETRVTGTTVPIMQGSNNINSTYSKDLSGHRWIDLKAIVPSDPSTFGFAEIGRVVGPHGVHGELKLDLNTDFADFRVRNGSILYLKKPSRKTPRPVRILSSRKMQNHTYLVFIEGIKNRLMASFLQKYDIYVRLDDRPKLEADEFLLRDLIGLRCYLTMEDLENRSFFATVEGVIPPEELVDKSLQHLMHSMIELRLRGTRRYCLVPFVSSIVTQVLLSDKALIIDPPKGLLTLSYDEEKKVVIRGYLPSKISWLTDKDRSDLMKSSIRLFPEGGTVVFE